MYRSNSDREWRGVDRRRWGILGWKLTIGITVDNRLRTLSGVDDDDYLVSPFLARRG